MHDLVVGAADFFMSTIAVSENDAIAARMVIDEYVDGADLRDTLESHNLKFSTFVKVLSADHAMASIFECSQAIHHKALVYELKSIVRAAASEDWKAARWLLEKLEPEKYGQRISIEAHTTKTDPAIVDAVIAEYSRV